MNSILTLVLIAAAGFSAGEDWEPVQSTQVEPDPNGIVVFQKPHYKGYWIKFLWDPSTRHRLIPVLGTWNDMISSFKVGSNVRVVFFRHVWFHGSLQNFGGKVPIVSDTSLDDDSISSLIIYPKNKTLPDGVHLKADWHGFGEREQGYFPLPEEKHIKEAHISVLDDYLDEETERVYLYGGIEVSLYQGANFKGKELTLPDWAHLGKTYFDLDDYGFAHKTSSLIIREVGKGSIGKKTFASGPQGNENKPGYRPPDRREGGEQHEPDRPETDPRAAEMLEQRGVKESLLGRYHSNRESIFFIERAGEAIRWRIEGTRIWGIVEVRGLAVVLVKGEERNTGEIRAVNREGTITVIEFRNGLILER